MQVMSAQNLFQGKQGSAGSGLGKKKRKKKKKDNGKLLKDDSIEMDMEELTKKQKLI